MGAREDTKSLNNLAIQAVGALLGAKLPAQGMARCPLPYHNDTTPSFEIRSGGLRWICYRCDEKGGAIDLVIAARRLPFSEAKQWLAEASGLFARPLRQGVQQRRRPPAPVVPRQSLRPTQSPVPTDLGETQADHELYASLLGAAPLLSTGRNYLLGRSLSDRIIARFAVGQMPSVDAMIRLVDQFGFARVEASGLLTKTSTRDRYWPIFPAGALLFPYLEGGRVAYLQARIIMGEAKGSRWRNLNHRKRRLFNTDVLVASSTNHVAICEGAIDVLSAAELGRDAIGLIGVSARLTDAEMIALRGKQVDLLLDWDEAGDKRAVTLRKELSRFGVAATRKTAPKSGAKDVNDYLREGNASI
ncbi:MAG: toprim domain-containing protein [Novosphingobium sp.]|nr:toprim domain-containing protein [Novosphingobium sp.]